MTLTFLLANSGRSPATVPSSVVHTGVKSAGWENRIPHLNKTTEDDTSSQRVKNLQRVGISYLLCTYLSPK